MYQSAEASRDGSGVHVPTSVVVSRDAYVASVRKHTERIKASRMFARAPRMQNFLTFLIEETLAGRSASLKEYTVALNVFEKSEDFDPRFCPIVRVEAGRLRKLLTQYHWENSNPDEVVIEIPKGRYVPKISIGSVSLQCE